MRDLRRIALAIALLGCSCLFAADEIRVTVDPAKEGVRISPTLYGVFFEEINRAGEGGLYAEMLQNRSFGAGGGSLEAWKTVGAVKVSVDRGQARSSGGQASVRLEIGAGEAGLVNAGYGYRAEDKKANRPERGGVGLALRAGERYRLSVRAMADERLARPLVAQLLGKDGKELARAEIGKPGGAWEQFTVELAPSETDLAGQLAILAAGPAAGTMVWLDDVSLMPVNTWKGLPLRRDLAEMIAAMKPAFVRFPGGCYVEGYSLGSAERWKNTIGDLAERTGTQGLWGYHSSGGLGVHEYLLWCEAMDAEPLYVINCGMTHGGNVPMEQMGPWVQDALDLVEYARGPADSTWGSLRAKAGHPAPFRFNYIEVGNENGGEAYYERYALFHDAIKAKYPDLKIIANHWDGGFPKNRPVEIVDEHAYADPAYFLRHAGRFDSYDRKGYRVYMGEYAVTSGCGQGNVIAAVAEAAFMLGMERNSDVVTMSSYAPLLCNVVQKAWNPNAINFDQARVAGTPSYHVQAMLAGNRGDVVLATDVQASEQPRPRSGVIGVGTWETQAQYKDLKVERDGKMLYASDFSATAGLTGWKAGRGKWQLNDGTLVQTTELGDCRTTFGDANWNSYTYSLKARKTGGKEGFLILFAAGNGAERCWWNLGGWGNSQHALEFGDGATDPVPGRIETDRWYDIRVELSSEKVRCYLDGKLVHDVAWPTPKTVHALATRDEKAGEVIVKLVNASEQVRPAVIEITGAGRYAPVGRAVVLTGKADDENTLEEPHRVVPQEQQVEVAGRSVHYRVPAMSVSVIRVQEAK